MASLSAHLREPGDHGALAFHPGCPACREERLAGTLRTDALVGRRGQALFAAGALALSATPATAALAQEPDQEQEGAAAPDQAAVSDPASDPDFDPGGESTDLPVDGGPTTDTPDAAEPDDDTGAVEQEPTTNEDAPIADAGDGTSTAAEQPTPTAEPTLPPPTPDPAGPEPLADAPSATPVPTEHEADTRPDARYDARKQSRRHADHQSASVPAPAPAPAPVATASEPREATTVDVSQEPSAPRASSAADGRGARPGDRSHVVRPGESLWLIARDVLGDGASVARIAREVNRLWALNSERIGTGDPDLLMVGTRLVLR